ncbi:MAG: 50S ribosome-binding GTPase [Firmicutes bacterium]|nr:50S ribosome-binding GTPase [Bacillota bacterium]
MGLTRQSTGRSAVREIFNVAEAGHELVIALAGNPNTGKSTVFNALTGLRQHTGNWPGKTVLRAEGSFRYAGRKYNLIDLPGTYSLYAASSEEEVARDFLCFGNPDATVVVADGTCLERNLNLALQVMEITGKVILCVNLIDEARRKKMHINVRQLSLALGVPVVPTAARGGEGLPELLETIREVALGLVTPQPILVRYPAPVEEAVARLEPKVREITGKRLNARWVALRLLEGDVGLVQAIRRYCEEGCEHQTLQLTPAGTEVTV